MQIPSAAAPHQALWLGRRAVAHRRQSPGVLPRLILLLCATTQQLWMLYLKLRFCLGWETHARQPSPGFMPAKPQQCQLPPGQFSCSWEQQQVPALLVSQVQGDFDFPIPTCPGCCLAACPPALPSTVGKSFPACAPSCRTSRLNGSSTGSSSSSKPGACFVSYSV